MTDSKDTLASTILRTLSSADCRASYSFWGKAGGSFTALELGRRISGTAGALRGAGLRARQVVPILCPTSVELWTTFLGAMAGDLVPANLPLPTFKTHLPTYLRNLDALLTRYDTDTVIASRDVRDRLEGFMTRRIQWMDPADLQTDASVGNVDGGSSGVAFLQHSSGSTGVPKGVAITNDAAVNHLRAYATAIDLDPARDLVTSWLPLYHDMGLVTSFLLPLAIGVSCRSTNPEGFILNPLGFMEDMATSRATLSWWPNFTFALLADRRRAIRDDAAARPNLSAVRALINCSEVVMGSSIDRFVDAFATDGLSASAIRSSYAMAENVFAVTQTKEMAPSRVEVQVADLEPGKRPIQSRRVENVTRTLVSSGRPLDGVTVRIVDSARQEVPMGIVGEIAIAGPFVFAEYLELAAETESAKQDGWYFTRDLGFLWRGELYVLGRETDLIIVGGRKFLPNEIERIAGEVEGVKAGRAVSFGVRSELKGTQDAVMVVESAEATEPTRSRAIRRAITQAVLQQMDLALNDVRVVAEGTLIKTSSGKIARNDNRKAYIQSLVETPSRAERAE